MTVFRSFLSQCTQLSVAFVLLSVSFLGSVQAEQVQELRVAVAKGTKNIDPKFATDAFTTRLLRLVNPALIRIDKYFKPQPHLAIAFQQQTSTLYSVTLPKKNYHDGTALTPQSVKMYLEEIQNPKTLSPLRVQLQNVADIQIKKQKLIFVLKKPDPLFWQKLHEIPIAKAKSTVGAGLYKIAEFVEGSHIMLQHINTSKRLKFITVKDPTVRLLKLQKKEVDVLHNDLPVELVTYANMQNFSVQQTLSASYTYLGFQHEKGATATLTVRRAMAHAINMKEVRQYLLMGQAVSAHSLLMPNHPAYWPAPIRVYNPKLASALLEAAGYTKNDKGIRLTLTLSVKNSPFMQRLAQVIQLQLKQVGIALNIRSADWGTFYDQIKKGQVETYILTWVGRFQPDFFNYIFHSNQWPPNGLNRGRYKNEAMDAALNKMNNATHIKDLYKAAIHVQQLQHQNILYLPLYRRNHVLISQSYIKGCKLDEEGGFEGLTTCKK